MTFAEKSNRIFRQATEAYHEFDNVDAVIENPYAEGDIDHVLFAKNMVDAVQWHLEDIIRDPEIDPVAALALKRQWTVYNREEYEIDQDMPVWAGE